jgi:hypothetical protein
MVTVLVFRPQSAREQLVSHCHVERGSKVVASAWEVFVCFCLQLAKTDQATWRHMVSIFLLPNQQA